MWWLLVLAALPERVDLKHETAAFTASHDVALDEGKLWWRPRGTTEWRLMPPDGLPAPKGRLEALKELAADVPLAPPTFVRPSRIVRLSADGDNLLAVSDEGVGYYTKLSTLEWTDVWGPTGLKAPLRLDATVNAFAMSHRKIPYEDLDGNPHPVTAGVTTVYALLESGRRLAYADPWLPAGWTRSLCLPERNTFIASTISASASTMFVMDAAGRMFTRLADFDTVGDDPALPYSWTRERRSGALAAVRTLPGEDWRAQPPIPGKHSTRLTILQTGTTNADRELRVEGAGGYWKKPLLSPTWSFEKTGLPLTGAALVATPPTQPSRETTWTTDATYAQAKLRLENFDPDCSPATLVLEGQDEVLRLPLHFHGGLEFEKAERDLSGVVLMPQTSRPKKPWRPRRLTSAMRLLATGQPTLNVELDVKPDEVVIKSRPLRNAIPLNGMAFEWRFKRR
ncbi:MAG: hypothetical protein ABTQ32_24465 [Myxococcaceae bacterium]